MRAMESPMRAAILFCTGSILLATPSHSATSAPASSDEAARVRLEAISNRSPEEWQGRQHYLYDEIISRVKKPWGPLVQTR